MKPGNRMDLAELERELYSRALAHEGMTLFQQGRVKDALVVASKVVNELMREGHDGLAALGLLDVASCLDGTGENDSRLAVLLDAVKHARRYGNADLTMRTEIWRIDHIMKTGSFREAVLLLNALLRKKAIWQNGFNENLLFGRLGHAYLGLSRFDYAVQCFDELLQRASLIGGDWHDAAHARCGLAIALCTPLWTTFETSIFRSQSPLKGYFKDSDEFILIKIEQILSEDRGKQFPAGLHLNFELLQGRLTALRGDFQQAQQIANAAWQFGNETLPSYSGTRRLSHLQSILHLNDLASRKSARPTALPLGNCSR